ncbi:MAG: SMC-Scp complex subunit ScpB [Candidatus Heimdallarchaeota archaeon]|nr:SMC-Scp complex subunit ScpB [Candidatus Heimdallarchaeota archaeon]
MKKNEKQLVESVLFSASQPVSITQIKEATGLSRKKIRDLLDTLMEEYTTTRQSAMEIIKAGEKYVMQVKEEFHEQSFQVTPTEMDDSMLKTLSLIAFHQPVKQSNLRRMAGEKIYQHVDDLTTMHLIHTKKHRNTELITLSKRFPEYFGLDVTKPEDIRDFLAKKIVDDISTTKSK